MASRRRLLFVALFWWYLLSASRRFLLHLWLVDIVLQVARYIKSCVPDAMLSEMFDLYLRCCQGGDFCFPLVGFGVHPP